LRAGRLISLVDMIEFFAAGLAHNWQWLISEQYAFNKKALASPDGKPSAMEIHNLMALLKTNNVPVVIEGKSEIVHGWMFYLEQLGMIKSKAVMRHFLMILNTSNAIPNFSVIDTHLGAIRNSLWYELFERKFTFIPLEKAGFFERDNLFDKAVEKSFPSAKSDIKAAGNCLAADLNTAAIFHLMRIVEYGLRGLAKDLIVPIPDEDLEYKQWKTIIDGIRFASKIKTECAGMSDKDKSETREFYNGVISEFEGFKDVWRNNVSHTRNSYSERQATDAFERVRSFMQRLATRVSETS
jgi:hypothetical protein